MTDVLQLEHKAGPTPDEAPFRRLCVRCGVFWPCPAKAEQNRAEFEERLDAVRVSDDARRVGVLALVERGVSVWSSTRVDAFDRPIGGVVVHIEDLPNPETGELERFFTCLDPMGSDRFPITVRQLAEAEVLPTGVEATSGSTLTKLVRRLAGEIHRTKGSWLDTSTAERVRWIYILTGVITLAA